MGRVRNGLRAYAVDDADPVGPAAPRARAPARVGPRLDGDGRGRVLRPRHEGAHVVARGSSAAPVCDRDGTTRFLDDVNATPLGTMGKNFATAPRRPRGRRLVVLYTDGLIERRDHLIDDGLDVARRAHEVDVRRRRPQASVDRSSSGRSRRARRPTTSASSRCASDHRKADRCRSSRSTSVGRSSRPGSCREDGKLLARRDDTDGGRNRRRRAVRRARAHRCRRIDPDGRRDARRRRLRRADGPRAANTSRRSTSPRGAAFPLRGRLAAHTGLPVFVDNDAKALALGEGWIGAAAGRRDYIGWSCRPASAAASCSTAACSTARTATPATSATSSSSPTATSAGAVRAAASKPKRRAPRSRAITGRPPAEAPPESSRAPARSSAARSRRSPTCSTSTSRSSRGSVALGFGAPFFAAAQAEIDARCRLDFSARHARSSPAPSAPTARSSAPPRVALARDW